MVDLRTRTKGLLTADDLRVGDWLDAGPWTVGAEQIVEFAQCWDPLPLHLDAAAAADGPFGSLIASGIHTLAICHRLLAEDFYARLDVVAGRGIDRMRLPRPVRPGARLTVRQEISGIAARPGRADRCDVQGHAVMTDQVGDVVLDLISTTVVRRSPTPTPPPSTT